MVVKLHVVDLDRAVVPGRVRKRRRGCKAGQRNASGEGYRPAGLAYESSNAHEFPREVPASKATRLASEAAAT